MSGERRSLMVILIIFLVLGALASIKSSLDIARDLIAQEKILQLKNSEPELYEEILYAIRATRGEFSKYIDLVINERDSVYFDYANESLRREYVEPNRISPEEPYSRWHIVMRRIACSILPNRNLTPYSAARILCAWVHGAIAYDWNYWMRREPTYIFTKRRGTCTNHAILYIALCRSIGIPARFVRDYQISNVTHSWAEVFVDGRWVHADPTWGVFDDRSIYSRSGYKHGVVLAYSPLTGWYSITGMYVENCSTLLLTNDGNSTVFLEIVSTINGRVLFWKHVSSGASARVDIAPGRYILRIIKEDLEEERELIIGGNERMEIRLGG